jgi:hypothetical protein
VEAHARVDERTKKLSLFGREVSVVYFRAGYAPADYPGEAEWAARMALERSAAVKCPTPPTPPLVLSGHAASLTPY